MGSRFKNPVDEDEAYRLRKEEGLTYQQVADRFGVSRDGIRSAIGRAEEREKRRVCSDDEIPDTEVRQ